MDEATKIANMNAWLDQLCELYSVDREAVRDVTGDLLQMSRDVSHGPARPGVPLTGFLLGFVAGREGGSMQEQTRKALSDMQPLLDPYRNEDGIIP